MKQAFRIALLAFAAAGFPAAAFAHVGVDATHDFMHGFSHPIGGLDHILAMVTTGMFAAYLGRHALWLVPVTFVLMMAGGGALGSSGVALPFVELGIAASVIVLGLAVAMQWNLPTAVAAGMAGFFAVFHGFAHGAEMPADASGLQYAAGFMMATALLHVAGIGIALAIARIGMRAGGVGAKASGGLAALAGIGILTGYL